MHDPHSERMSGSETRAASGLALVFVPVLLLGGGAGAERRHGTILPPAGGSATP